MCGVSGNTGGFRELNQEREASVVTNRGSFEMVDLLAAVGALVAVLAASCFFGKKKKQAGLARVLEQPGSVARLYLREAPEIAAYWLHAEFKTGKKARLAAPWELVDTLKRLEALGLKLSEDDQAALDLAFAEQAERFQSERDGSARRNRQTGVAGSAIA